MELILELLTCEDKKKPTHIIYASAKSTLAQVVIWNRTNTIRWPFPRFPCLQLLLQFLFTTFLAINLTI